MTNNQLYAAVIAIAVGTTLLTFHWLEEARRVQTRGDSMTTNDWREAKKFVHGCKGHTQVWHVNGHYRLRCVEPGENK